MKKFFIIFLVLLSFISCNKNETKKKSIEDKKIVIENLKNILKNSDKNQIEITERLKKIEKLSSITNLKRDEKSCFEQKIEDLKSVNCVFVKTKSYHKKKHKNIDYSEGVFKYLLPDDKTISINTKDSENEYIYKGEKVFFIEETEEVFKINNINRGIVIDKATPEKTKPETDHFYFTNKPSKEWIEFLKKMDKPFLVSIYSVDCVEVLSEINSLNNLKFLVIRGTLDADPKKLNELESPNIYYKIILSKPYFMYSAEYEEYSYEKRLNSLKELKNAKNITIYYANDFAMEYGFKVFESIENVESLKLFGEQPLKGELNYESKLKKFVIFSNLEKINYSVLKKSPSLEYLELNGSTDSNFLHYTRKLQNLKILILNNNKMKFYGSFFPENIQVLDLSDCENADNYLTRFIDGKETLNYLNLKNTKINIYGLTFLKELKKLKMLCFDYYPEREIIDNDLVQLINNLPLFEQLDVRSHFDSGFGLFLNRKNIEKLIEYDNIKKSFDHNRLFFYFLYSYSGYQFLDPQKSSNNDLNSLDFFRVIFDSMKIKDEYKYYNNSEYLNLISNKLINMDMVSGKIESSRTDKLSQYNPKALKALYTKLFLNPEEKMFSYKSQFIYDTILKYKIRYNINKLLENLRSPEKLQEMSHFYMGLYNNSEIGSEEIVDLTLKKYREYPEDWDYDDKLYSGMLIRRNIDGTLPLLTYLLTDFLSHYDKPYEKKLKNDPNFKRFIEIYKIDTGEI